ncbi:hypothetical protein JRQ81_007644 [Phrynocephalus forsythii]|uniref:L-amino-acid oxidase n=1 Tax=Phrynocephalus forsythii TaxID=171643 RepID=A0A9Q1ATH4_9SAUR|nr:hypothetical protein JRQ81_007644 [Phrynocephalus forsythii]
MRVLQEKRTDVLSSSRLLESYATDPRLQRGSAVFLLLGSPWADASPNPSQVNYIGKLLLGQGCRPELKRRHPPVLNVESQEPLPASSSLVGERLVEVKIEVVLPEKERTKDEMSPNGKASPIIYKANGTSRHYQLEEHSAAINPYRNVKDIVEASVCHVKDLDNGQMREVDLGCGKALLVKENGEFYATGYKCPHYGAPLVKGVLSKGRVRCPWHGACFNIVTGDIEDFPGLDSLPKFQVKIEKEKVYIRASKQALQMQRRTKVMAKWLSLSNYSISSTNVLIIGAGPAGLVCAETLRQEGFSDRIVMCTMDRNLPYDRPKLSKSMESQADQIALRPKEFFRTYDIEVLTEMQVVAIDVKNKTAIFKDGFKMEYNKLLLATGSTPKTLSCKGKEVENVFTIRTVEDANRVVKLATGKNVVVVGASFLGMEVAAYLSDKAHSVSVVELEEMPFKKFFGEKVGRAIMKMFENNWVKFYMQTEVAELREQEGKLKEVVLKSGKILRADVCVIGIGAIPTTGFLKQSGIHIDSRGFIVVNKMMQASVPGVFAAGDAVTFPLALRNNKKVNIPHWQMAHMQGRIAALNMLAHGTEISTVPYLWTAMFGKSIRYAEQTCKASQIGVGPKPAWKVSWPSCLLGTAVSLESQANTEATVDPTDCRWPAFTEVGLSTCGFGEAWLPPRDSSRCIETEEQRLWDEMKTRPIVGRGRTEKDGQTLPWNGCRLLPSENKRAHNLQAFGPSDSWAAQPPKTISRAPSKPRLTWIRSRKGPGRAGLVWASEAAFTGRALAMQTPLPPNLRKGLSTFSGSLFINNKTSDSIAAPTYQSGPAVLSSLPLQMLLYFNAFYCPFWCLSEGVMLELKFHLLPNYYQALHVAAYLVIICVEALRLYLGYIGNLQEKVPELAGFALLSFLVEMPTLLFILADPYVLRLPLEIAVHLVLLLFLTSEITAASFALRVMTKKLAMEFFLKQFEEEPEKAGLGERSTRGWTQWRKVSWGSQAPISPDPLSA